MMKKNLYPMIISLVLISIAFVFVACEGGTTFSKTVKNNSSESIFLEVYTIYSDSIPSEYEINSGEEKQIYIDDIMGIFVTEDYVCTNEFDSIVVTVSNNKVLIKNIMDGSNWQKESKDGRNSEENCVFVVDEEDLQ